MDINEQWQAAMQAVLRRQGMVELTEIQHSPDDTVTPCYRVRLLEFDADAFIIELPDTSQTTRFDSAGVRVRVVIGEGENVWDLDTAISEVTRFRTSPNHFVRGAVLAPPHEIRRMQRQHLRVSLRGLPVPPVVLEPLLPTPMPTQTQPSPPPATTSTGSSEVVASRGQSDMESVLAQQMQPADEPLGANDDKPQPNARGQASAKKVTVLEDMPAYSGPIEADIRNVGAGGLGVIIRQRPHQKLLRGGHYRCKLQLPGGETSDLVVCTGHQQIMNDGQQYLGLIFEFADDQQREHVVGQVQDLFSQIRAG